MKEEEIWKERRQKRIGKWFLCSDLVIWSLKIWFYFPPTSSDSVFNGANVSFKWIRYKWSTASPKDQHYFNLSHYSSSWWKKKKRTIKTKRYLLLISISTSLFMYIIYLNAKSITCRYQRNIKQTFSVWLRVGGREGWGKQENLEQFFLISIAAVK